MTTAWMVGTAAMWAQGDPVTAVSILVGSVVAALGGWVGLRSYQARRQVDRVTIGLTSLESSLKRADVDRELQDARHAEDMARMEARHTDALAAMQRQLDALVATNVADNERCDNKLRRLGHIVKELGGKVPDDLNGLNAA